MKVVYLSLMCLMSSVVLAIPKDIYVQNGSKKIKFEVQTWEIDTDPATGKKYETWKPIPNQPAYIIEPNGRQRVTLFKGPGKYTFLITFVGLEQGSYVPMQPVVIEPNTIMFTIDDKWETEQYNYVYKPEPEVPCRGPGCW